MGTGKRILRYRKAKGLTQKQLAEKIGASESSVRLYELELRNPGKVQVKALAKALEISPAALADYNFETSRQILEALFRLEETVGLIPTSTKDGLALTIDPAAPQAQKLTQSLKAWQKMHDKYTSDEIGEEDYEAWKASFGV